MFLFPVNGAQRVPKDLQIFSVFSPLSCTGWDTCHDPLLPSALGGVVRIWQFPRQRLGL